MNGELSNLTPNFIAYNGHIAILLQRDFESLELFSILGHAVFKSLTGILDTSDSNLPVLDLL